MSDRSSTAYQPGGTYRHARPNSQFTLISNDFLRDKRLTGNALRVGCYLLSQDAGWRNTQESVAKALGIAHTTVATAYAYLEECGYLHRLRNTDEHGHRIADTLLVSDLGFSEEDLASLTKKSLARDVQPRENRAPKKTISRTEDLRERASADAEPAPQADGALFEAPPPAPASQSTRAKPKRLLKDVPWGVKQKHREQAIALRVNVALEAEKFRNYWQAEGRPKADWDAAFRNWLIKASEYNTTKQVERRDRSGRVDQTGM